LLKQLSNPGNGLMDYCAISSVLKTMIFRLLFIFVDALLINLGFVLAFFIRYGLPLPKQNFLPYKNSYLFLTVIYLCVLAVFGVFRNRFRSSWDLLQRVSLAVFLGTLLSVAFVYVFRIRWEAFPTSVFAISFLVNLLLIFKVNQLILKLNKRIKKQVIILGEGKVDDVVGKKAYVERKRINEIRELVEYSNVDEIVVSEKITNAQDVNLLLYLQRKLKAEVLFSPSVYLGLLPEKINGTSPTELLSTFVGRRSDLDEFFIAILDISTALVLLILAAVPMLIISILIKLTSGGKVIYKQERVGKDGKIFTLYKFRTMVKDAEKKVGPTLAKQDDPRITKIGKIMRRTRMDELPQLFNVLCGQMSLVGPRPERPHFVKIHKVLQGLRLAVKPGLTGLAQVHNFYDLHPKHKIRYDYLYVQRSCKTQIPYK
jgi:lipopolysaccharide/colanic/teichoic acid biosynthesis glycosyltransferase